MIGNHRRARRLRFVVAATVLLLAAAADAVRQDTAAQSPKQPARANPNTLPQSEVVNVGPKGTPCTFDLERGEVPNCVRESASGEFFVAPELLKELHFDSHGLVAVLSPEEGWMYVSRRGKVVISGVPVMDNWADSFHDGLVRIVRNKKYGFANRRGQVVVPPVYEGAMNFKNGRATVCKGCEDKCAETECEHHFFSGGEWFRINTKGTVLARLHPDS